MRDVEVFSRFIPEIISFDQLRALNTDPRMLGRTWIRPEACALLAFLILALRFVMGLDCGFASLMQFGYFVISDEAFHDYFTEDFPAIKNDLRAILPGQPVPASGEELLLTLENIKGSLWPLRPGPILRRYESALWVDMHAASSLLDVLLEFPRPKGNEIANVRAEHFEVAVQNVIDASKWRPFPERRSLVRRELRIDGKAISDVYALATRNKTIILVSCKSVIYSEAYDTGDHKTVRNAASTVQDGVVKWQEVIARLKSRPVGDNYDFSAFDDLVPVLCTPYPVYVPVGIATQNVRPSLRAVVSVGELSSWLEENT